MYQEIKPSKRIDKVIDTFWVFSKNEASERFKILPDTCSDLIFDLNQNKGFLSGIMSTYQFRALATETNLIGVRFKIENFASLFKISLNETKNLRVELSDFLPTNKLHTLNQLTDLEATRDRIDFLEDFIAASFSQNAQRQDNLVLSVVQKIKSLNGVVNIVDLAKWHHISLRQLERRFKSYIGLTVKEFSNIVRFNNAKKAIGSFTKTSLLEIAYDLGFFDHSHMTNEFKRISGEVPSFFR